MKSFILNKFKLKSHMDIRILREDENDVDIIIPLEKSVLNLTFENAPKSLRGRIQFTDAKNIILRFCKSEEYQACTVHVLKSIDLFSAVANFELDYSNISINISNSIGSTEMVLYSNEVVK
ncbi:hypothetical protein PV797_19150 [Clostridiaceae bacterium M8S5]|nr:hypothetical protein PV797_19150 [Clostridiaceae bacterium M8S5]